MSLNALSGGNHILDGPAGPGDFIAGTPAELMSDDGKLTRQFAIAEDFDQFGSIANQAGLEQSGGIDSRAFVKTFELLDVNDSIVRLEVGIVKPALGQTPEERHLTAFVQGKACSAGARIITIHTASGGLTEPGTSAATAASSGFMLTNYSCDFMIHHGCLIPL